MKQPPSPVEAVMVAACSLYGVRRANLLDGDRTRSTVLCRQQIIGALLATRQWAQRDVAELLGLDPSSVSTAFARHARAVATHRVYRDFSERLAVVLRETPQ